MTIPGVTGLVIRVVVGVFLFLGSYVVQPFLGAVAWPIFWLGLVLLAFSALQLVFMLCGALLRAVGNWIMKLDERERN